jgi:hypothetical protein
MVQGEGKDRKAAARSKARLATVQFIFVFTDLAFLQELCKYYAILQVYST